MKERIIYMDAKDEGREETLSLINRLIHAGRSDEIERVTVDAEYRQKVMEELYKDGVFASDMK